MEGQKNMRRMALAALLGCFLMGALRSAAAQVQTVTDITGAVSDAQGASDLWCRHYPAKPEHRRGSEGEEQRIGFLFVSVILPATYTVTASYSGFKTYEVTNRVAAVAEPPSTVRQNQHTGRIDWDESEKTRIFGSFTYFDDYSVQTGIATIADIENPFGKINPTLSWVQTFSPEAINDLTVAFTRAHFANSRAIAGFGNIAEELGSKNTSTNPAVRT